MEILKPFRAGKTSPPAKTAQKLKRHQTASSLPVRLELINEKEKKNLKI